LSLYSSAYNHTGPETTSAKVKSDLPKGGLISPPQYILYKIMGFIRAFPYMYTMYTQIILIPISIYYLPLFSC
jgi:hypothetical protein